MENEAGETESNRQFPATTQENHRVDDRDREDLPAAILSLSPNTQSHKRQDGDHDYSRFHEVDAPPQTPKRAKRTSQSDPPPPLPVLPQELIVEILCRLPVKTLLRFRCVGKSFKTLISSHQFIKTHLKKITNLSKNNPNPSQRLILTSYDRLFKSCSLCSLYNNPQTDAIPLENYSLRDKYRFDWVVGSCDGLLCVAIKQDFVALCNPSTRVFNRLPDLGFNKKSGSYTVFGFGYDDDLNDYKVVAVYCCQNRSVNGGHVYETRVKVCTVKTRRWRSIENFGYGIPFDVSGRYTNGTLNWPVCESDSALSWIIVSFDLAKEKYKEVMQPDYGEVGSDQTLGVLNGWLCVTCNYSRVRADLWVMKEYGVRESWTKVVSIPYLDYPGSLRWGYSVPLCISDDGEVLMEFESALVIYNPRNDTFRCPVINGAGHCFEAELYIQSLVSPTAENSILGNNQND